MYYFGIHLIPNPVCFCVFSIQMPTTVQASTIGWLMYICEFIIHYCLITVFLPMAAEFGSCQSQCADVASLIYANLCQFCLMICHVYMLSECDVFGLRFSFGCLKNVCTLNFAHELYLDVRKIMSMFVISIVPQKDYVISQKKCTNFFWSKSIQKC